MQTVCPKIGILIIVLVVSVIALLPLHSLARDTNNPDPSDGYSREELAQMLAPIALYPDALLSQVLMASTYPIEVIEADRWIRKNPELKDDSLDNALLDRDWDPSVKALCHFRPVLSLMSERITETTNIGNAFLAQEEEVMAMIQELRAAAYARGNLTTSNQKIIVEKEIIIIEPADPRIIYVPYYDPLYIYGPWWYPAYPPYYWGPSRVSIGFGISFWPGFHFGFIFGDWGYFDWHRHYIYINVKKRPRYVRHDRFRPESGRWSHSTRHRRGVAYRDKRTARKYGQYPQRRTEFRYETRGFPDRRDRDRHVEGRISADRDRPERVRTELQKRETQQIERRKKERVRVEPQIMERMRIEQQKKERVRVEPQIQQRQRVERRKVERVEVKPKRMESKRERNRDNVFNRVDEGRVERESSRRGRSSRQGEWGDNRRGREGRGRGAR